ncbi:protein-L-isoaspartate O-methyltransferase family protein [Hydrogenophilus thermoluteolus]|uniref:Protein-L-isoaspartate O-methyltransferase n=1 Tax=Hydrogenophilus thermoluteolus TaxID=297 RepID=A0A2Z6DX22_HYDTE|nr:protein-L-isoaspartate O-methyltransferase [Hydrogenophilus thermoluteolus]BBD76997.1 protein-L-isoaspartate O-methyltransferase [Hydrogenophilus thermoluteolus]GLW60038.1 protein-L-isoaspartate O-methyltransferase [Hydrogenophilus thermoluteolus]
MDWEKARFNMVEQQVRTWEVFDLRVLDTLMTVKRERFVPPQHCALAFADVEIPLPEGEQMLRPVVEAKALQALMIQPDARILEVGTGSGFFAACLAHLGGSVVTVERKGVLAEYAAQALQDQGVRNVEVMVGDALVADDSAKWWREGPYDVIVLSGGLRQRPDHLLRYLKVGGRLLAFVGTAPVMEAVRFVCTAPGAYREEGVFETVVPMLVEPSPALAQAA